VELKPVCLTAWIKIHWMSSFQMTMEWHEVVQRLLEKQGSGEYRVSINRHLTAHDIASRIMRRENFLIALFNMGILDLRLRLPFIGTPQAF
jgi:hypothetical protein